MLLSNEQLERRRSELEAELREPVTVDGLTRTWSIFQRRKGHRHSTDDLLTGWYALEKTKDLSGHIERCLDLGTGIGGVGLLVLYGLLELSARRALPFDARLTCIEAQDISFRFLQENIRANDVEDRVDAIHGDLRELALPDRFPLVTGSPPYFDVNAGIVPADSQKAHARFELRGDVRDYVRAAKRHLEDDGLFVFCFPWQQKSRAVSAVLDEGFHLVSRDVIPREGLSPLFSLFACGGRGRSSDSAVSARENERACGSFEKDDAHVIEEPFIVRHEDGSHTPAMHAVRARFGWAASKT